MVMRVGAIDHHALDVEEEVGLVLDDRTAEVGAVGLQLRVRLVQPVLLHEEVFLRHARVLPQPGRDAVKRVRALTC